MRVYLKSMQTRYFIELALFLGLAVLFQKMIGDFQKDFKILNDQYMRLVHMKTDVTVTPDQVRNQRTITKNTMHDTADRLE
jgi:hypothetical protein